MKVYMAIDMEGISGVMQKAQIMKGNKEYEEARYFMVKDVNAAVEGALEGGADEVYVADVHGSGYNLPFEEIHPEARFIMGSNASLRFPYLDNTVDMAFLIGYHAMAGTREAVLDHTYSFSNVYRFIVNGRELGEIEIDALRCGRYGVPVALVTGDDKACAEASGFFGNIETAVVKHGIARFASLNLPLKKARELIRQKACEAVRRAGSFKPFRIDPPYEVEVEYSTSDCADAVFVNGRDNIRTGPRTILFKTENVLDLFITMP